MDIDEQSVLKTLGNLRDQISKTRAELKEMAARRPDYGAELVLAMRHLEDARMRLGVAVATIRGDDPFAHKQEGEE